MDTAARSFFEPRFGVDFSNVRLHDDAAARRSAEAVSARAYTVGSNTPPEARDPEPHLLAHELAHVGQQGAGARTLRRASDFDITGVNPNATVQTPR